MHEPLPLYVLILVLVAAIFDSTVRDDSYGLLVSRPDHDLLVTTAFYPDEVTVETCR